MMNIMGMEVEELRKLAIQQGLSPHHKANKDTLLGMIFTDLQTKHNDGIAKAAQDVKPEPVKQKVFTNTVEQVQEAIAPIHKRVPEFSAVFDGDVFNFKCKGAEESGNINQPMFVIVRIANNIARGRFVPMSLNGHFDKMGSSGQNAYTETVFGG